MKTVMVFGAFDILHEGHLHYFSQAKQFGEKLVVVVARDETIKHIKKRVPYTSENDRVKELNRCDLVDIVVLGNIEDKYQVIIDKNPDVLVFGYDQSSFNIGIEKELEKRNLNHIEIKTIPTAFEPHKYKSSIIYNSKK